MILTPLQKLTKNVGDLGKIIVAKCFEWLPKVQKIAQSGHTGISLHFNAPYSSYCVFSYLVSFCWEQVTEAFNYKEMKTIPRQKC